MGLFDDLQNTPAIPDEDETLKPRAESLAPTTGIPISPEESIFVARRVREEIEAEETDGPTIKQQIAGLTAEIAISGGAQAGAVPASVASGPFAPVTWVGTTFSGGYAGSVAAQKIEGREDISQGRALFAGLINTIPFLSKGKQGTKLAVLTRQLGSQAAQGAAMGAGEVTSVAVIDKKRMPTINELGFGVVGGATIGAAFGGSIEGVKILAPKTKDLFNKISGKTADEIDVMVAKGEILTEDIADAMEDIADAPKTPEAPKEAPATPKEAPEANPAPKTPEADPLDASIEAINEILTGDRTGGKGARVTRKVKSHFRVVAQEFFGDIDDLLKTKDVETAKKILGRIDKYTEFDRAISKKDYAQGSELQANTRQAMDNGTTDYAAGITAAGNKRTEDLIVLKVRRRGRSN